MRGHGRVGEGRVTSSIPTRGDTWNCCCEKVTRVEAEWWVVEPWRGERWGLQEVGGETADLPNKTVSGAGRTRVHCAACRQETAVQGLENS